MQEHHGISDPGEIIVKEAIKNNIDVIPVPGACAAISALIASGINTSEFIFIGFLPVKNSEKREKIKEIKKQTQTIIFYEAPHKLLNTLNTLKEELGERRIVLAREITKIHEEFIRKNIDEILNEVDNLKGEMILIIEGATKAPEEENKLNELTLEEEKVNDDHSSLLDEYEMSKRAYSDVCDVYTKVNNRLSERKRKYVSKKHSRHINSVMLIALVCAFSCASVYRAFGFVTDKFLLYWGSTILAPIAGMIDIKFFWDKLRKKYTDEFENLDSTIETKDTLDRMYAQKLRNENKINKNGLSALLI